jgi:uncharacterized protein involved in exopolysaccharide biosynthesis
MQELQLDRPHTSDVTIVRIRAHTVRDIAAIAFRRRVIVLTSFLGVFLGAILMMVLQPNHYDASMKILVKRDRADPVVTSEAISTVPPSGEVTEEELNSEVALLKSRDLLEQIVLRCGLQHAPGRGVTAIFGEGLPPYAPGRQASERAFSHEDLAHSVSGSAQVLSTARIGSNITSLPVRTPSQDVEIARAIRTLEKNLRTEVIKKTNLIQASYESSDRQLSAKVLSLLGTLYLEKHVAVHRPRGAYDFFQRETDKYRKELSAAEKRLMDFNREANVISAPLQKDAALQKLADFQVTLSQTNAAIAETQQRIRVLKQTLASIPPRMVTQVRNGDDGMLISQLKANLVALEQKRIELLTKFQPEYRSVKEVDAQIADVRAALSENSKIHEETTDQDPTHEWARGELAKSNADLAALNAREQATSEAIRSYQERALLFASKEVTQADLTRAIKSAEDNYLLSERKEEEARISDALDRGRILNVAIAEVPTVPALPSNDRLQIMAFGFLLAVISCAALAFAAERADPTFRTSDELSSILNIPVLAAIPRLELEAPRTNA